MIVNILGTDYKIEIRNKKDDKYLEKCDGYCDQTTHIIVVLSETEDCELADFKSYQKKVLRHEIIHAFLYEYCLNYIKTHDGDYYIEEE